MVQADADILLIDEVLAVGDAAFQQKCADMFHEMRDPARRSSSSPTTCSPSRTYCDRAMLIDEGEIRLRGRARGGRPALPAAELRPRRGRARARSAAGQRADDDARVVTRPGSRTGRAIRSTNLEQGEPIRFRAEVEATRDVPEPSFGVPDQERRRRPASAASAPISPTAGGRRSGSRPGSGSRISATIENPLNPGRYSIDCLDLPQPQARRRRRRQLRPARLRRLRIGLGAGHGLARRPRSRRPRRRRRRSSERLGARRAGTLQRGPRAESRARRRQGGASSTCST